MFAVSINLSDFRAATLLLHLFQSRCPVNIRYIMELQTCNCGWHLFVLSLHDGSITLLFIFILVLTVSRWPSQVKCHGALSICSVFTSNFFSRYSFRSYPFQSWLVQVGEASRYSFRSTLFSLKTPGRSPPMSRFVVRRTSSEEGSRRRQAVRQQGQETSVVLRSVAWFRWPDRGSLLVAFELRQQQ